MSLTAFKRKSVIEYGSRRSAKGPSAVWLPRGPFGAALVALREAEHSVGPGFSLNSGHRNVGYIGKSYAQSKSNTPFRGLHPIGFGGTFGAYKQVEPLNYVREVDTLGTQYQYIKPSVLSTRGMLEYKYKGLLYGVYPARTVQPNYTGNQTQTASQGNYIDNLASANTCKLGVNDDATYVHDVTRCGPMLCKPGRSTARFKYVDLARNAPYGKNLRNPVDYTTYQLHLTRKCTAPTGLQKPFPFSVAGGSSIGARGTSVTNVGTACMYRYWLTPPPGYYSENQPVEVQG